MKTVSYGIGALSLIIAGAAVAQGGNWSDDQHALIVTASNTASNQLMVYNPVGAVATNGIAIVRSDERIDY